MPILPVVTRDTCDTMPVLPFVTGDNSYIMPILPVVSGLNFATDQDMKEAVSLMIIERLLPLAS